MTESHTPDVQRGAYFEDLQLGARYRTGGITVTEDAIVRFGLEWDMQPFHVNAQAAKASIFGSLIASGLHTILISYRLYDQTGLLGANALAGLGYTDIVFHKPVRPGDTLSVGVTIEELKPSRRGTAGVATLRLETFNQDEVMVLSLLVSILVARRESAAEV